MGTIAQAIKVGTASANAIHAADLGKVITVDGKRYKMCKAAAAIAAAGGKVVVSAVDGTTGNRTHVVNVSTTLNDPLVTAVIPSGQTGSTGTTGLVSGDYFYGQVAGDAQALVVDETHAGDALAVSTTAGAGIAIGTSTNFVEAELSAVYAVVLKSVSSATTNAAALTAVRLHGLD